MVQMDSENRILVELPVNFFYFVSILDWMGHDSSRGQVGRVQNALSPRIMSLWTKSLTSLLSQ